MLVHMYSLLTEEQNKTNKQKKKRATYSFCVQFDHRVQHAERESGALQLISQDSHRTTCPQLETTRAHSHILIKELKQKTKNKTACTITEQVSLVSKIAHVRD